MLSCYGLYFSKNGDGSYTGYFTANYSPIYDGYSSITVRVSKWGEGADSYFGSGTFSAITGNIETVNHSITLYDGDSRMFLEGVQMNIHVYGNKNGVLTDLNTMTYLIPSSRTSVHPSDYYPTFYPPVKHQYLYNTDLHSYGQEEVSNCAANAISTTLEVQLYKKTGTHEYLSNSWIHGTRLYPNIDSESVFVHETMQKLQTTGLIFARNALGNVVDDTDCLIDNRKRVNSQEFIEQNKNNNFANQTSSSINILSSTSYIITNYRLRYFMHFDVIEAVKNHVKTYGSAIISLSVSYNFLDCRSEYIAPYIDRNFYAGHALCILGWRTINNRGYWIVQNSWGIYWGNNGIAYLPFDYTGINIYDLPIIKLPSTTLCFPPMLSVAETTSTLTLRKHNMADSFEITIRNADSSVKSYNVVTNITFPITGLSAGTDYIIEIASHYQNSSETNIYKTWFNTRPKCGSFAYLFPYYGGDAYYSGYPVIKTSMYRPDNCNMTNFAHKIENLETGVQGWCPMSPKTWNGYESYWRSWFWSGRVIIQPTLIQFQNVYDYFTENTLYRVTGYTEYKGRYCTYGESYLARTTGTFTWRFAGKDMFGKWVIGTDKQAGLKFGVDETEWNKLILAVAEKYFRRNDYNYSVYTVYNGSAFSAFYFNDMKMLIDKYSNTNINSKVRGDPILASDLNRLKNCVNLI